MSRRAAAQIKFAGVEITDSIAPYLKSMTYTDYEADEADDLQITLEDRDGIWMEEWLGKAVDAAASSSASTSAAAESSHSSVYVGTSGAEVTLMQQWLMQLGYNLPVYGADGIFGTETLGAVRKFQSDHGLSADGICGPKTWAALSAEIDGAAAGGEAAETATGLTIEAVIVRQNWNGDGKDEPMSCGSFELDGIDCSGPPAEITIKATALPYNSQIRQTEKSKGWESYNLSGIAGEMASKNGMALMFLSADDPFYERVEQYKMSDIAFLKRLCHDAGISLKASANMLVLFDQKDYEQNTAALTIKKGDGSYTSYNLSIGTADTQYQSCRVSYNDPATGKSISAVAKIPDYEESDSNQQLEITAKVGSIGEALSLAEKRLRLHNKFCRTAEFSMPGNPALVAGVTVSLEGWGSWDGQYIISQSSHVISGGYTTTITMRRALDGY